MYNIPIRISKCSGGSPGTTVESPHPLLVMAADHRIPPPPSSVALVDPVKIFSVHAEHAWELVEEVECSPAAE